MGNCCRPGKSSMVWAGDDWDNVSSPAAEEPQKSHQDIATAAAAASSSTYSSSNNYKGVVREVKVKITKKELQELLEKANVEGILVEQVLARLVINKNGNSHHHVVEELLHHQHHPWKPTLKIIPE